MLKSMTMGLGLLGLLAACNLSYPVAVVGPGNTVYRGQATALFLEGGYFQASNGSNVCRGQYQPVPIGQTSTFPVNCTNGANGIGTALFQEGQSGGGFVTMQDGSQWQFIFGRGALRV